MGPVRTRARGLRRGSALGTEPMGSTPNVAPQACTRSEAFPLHSWDAPILPGILKYLMKPLDIGSGCPHLLPGCPRSFDLRNRTLPGNDWFQTAVLQASPPSPDLSSAQCLSGPLPSQARLPTTLLPPFPVTLSCHRRMALNKAARGLGPTESNCFAPKATVKLPP